MLAYKEYEEQLVGSRDKRLLIPVFLYETFSIERSEFSFTYEYRDVTRVASFLLLGRVEWAM